MKKISSFLLSIAILVLISACSDSSSSSNSTSEETSTQNNDEKILLKVADSFPTTNDLSSEGIVYFMDRVEELTNGQVEFEYYPAEQLGKADSFLDLTLSKTIDIGYTSYSTDRLPLSEVATLPGAYNNAQEGSAIIWDLVKDYLIDVEYLPNGVRPLYAVSLPQYQLVTNKEPVKELEEIKGKKVRVTGTMELAFDQLGAVPVFMPATEAYTAMERGTVDGLVFPFTSFKAYQIETLAKYSTQNANFGSFTVVYSINEDVYQSLPESVKEAMAQAGDEVVEHLSEFLDNKTVELIEEFSSQIELYELSDDKVAEWDKSLEPAWDKWAEDLDKRGFQGTETLEKFKELREEYRNN